MQWMKHWLKTLIQAKGVVSAHVSSYGNFQVEYICCEIMTSLCTWPCAYVSYPSLQTSGYPVWFLYFHARIPFLIYRVTKTFLVLVLFLTIDQILAIRHLTRACPTWAFQQLHNWWALLTYEVIFWPGIQYCNHVNSSQNHFMIVECATRDVT